MTRPCGSPRTPSARASALAMLCLYAACASPALGAGSEEFDRAVRPFLTAHCALCHGGDDPRGDLEVESLSSDLNDPKTLQRWASILDRIEKGEMPPKKRPRPPGPELRSVVETLRTTLYDADVARQRNEGRTDARRLNRAEYENTVRDLLAVDLKLQHYLPEDPISQGFDNIDEALTVSSVLMDRCLEAAAAALDVAIVHGPRPETKRWKVTMLKSHDDYRLKLGHRVLPDETVVFFNSRLTPIILNNFRAPVAGRYRFRVSAYAFQSPGKPLVMAVYAGAFDPTAPTTWLVGHYDVQPDEPHVYEFVQDLPPRGTIKTEAFRLGQRPIPDGSAYPGPGVAVQWVEVEGPLIDAWPPLSHTRLVGAADLEKGTSEDARRILEAFVPRAFRRPVTAEDVQPFVTLVQSRLDEGYAFEKALRVGLEAVLCSPQFLFLLEQPGKLGAYELASRLSYFLWSGPPDETLLRHAREGTLDRPEVLREQVERLLGDPKARAFTRNFTDQWLDLGKIDLTQPDKGLYPEYDELLQVSMVKESQRFFEEVLAHDLSVAQFIDSDFAMLNERLATHYGIPGVIGQEVRKVALPEGSHRGGVMTQGSVLKVTANGTTTSPVQRGKWVMERLLGRPVPPPPKSVTAVEPDVRGTTTIREQLAKHRDAPQCVSCHALIDPPGFALESFDVIGGWRESYRSLGKARLDTIVEGQRVYYGRGPGVDSTGELLDGRKFADIEEFKRLVLQEREQVARCLAEKLMIRATGHTLDFADRAAIELVLARTKAKDHGLRTLIHEIVQSPTFLSK